MSVLGDHQRRPPRRAPSLTAVALTLLALTPGGAILLAARGGQHERDARPSAAPALPAPGPILSSTAPRSAPATSPGPADAPAARRAAGRFLRSYLPVLYGRRPARDVRGVDPRLARSLRSATHPPRVGADRRPRVTRLLARAQGADRVLLVATIADGVASPYRIVFAVTRQPTGRWLVSELANY